jgi:CheY-like chemotaxis protein
VTLAVRDGRAEIAVADNGIGLPDDRARLFEPYVTRRESGTGLGLPIVKKIIEEHGGTLDLTDAPVFEGQNHAGALARIVLPLAREVGSARHRRTGEGMMTGDILVVDDEPDIRELIGDILRDEGFRVRLSADADSCLAEINANPPALVILDIWLKGQPPRRDRDPRDGAPRQPRDSGGDHFRPRQSRSRSPRFRQGAYDFIEKPFNIDQLLVVIQRATEAAPAAAREPAAEVAANAAWPKWSARRRRFASFGRNSTR